jgi:hypothetical protein
MPRESKYRYLDYEKNPKNMTDAAKSIGRDTVRGMGLDPDIDYGAIAKKKMSDFAIDSGVSLRDIGRFYKGAHGFDRGTPYEGEQGAQKLREARDEMQRETRGATGYKKGGMVKSASARADGIAKRGKTKGRIV